MGNFKNMAADGALRRCGQKKEGVCPLSLSKNQRFLTKRLGSLAPRAAKAALAKP